MADNLDKVSVVIPTVLRPELRRAVQTAREQHGVATEIIVVADTDSAAVRSATDLTAGADIVISTGGRKRGGFARNVGTDAATGAYIAYLDDDDWWFPTKLSNQLNAIRNTGAENDYVVGARVQQFNAGERGSNGRPSPSKLISSARPIEDYLFRNRAPTAGRPSFFTSTIFASESLIRTVRWDETLTRHQDWDFLLRLQSAGAKFIQVPDVLAAYTAGSTGSVSAAVDWEASLRWARQWRDRWSPQTYADFIAAQPLRYAVQSKSRLGVRASVAEIVRAQRIPSALSMAFTAGAIVPRELVLRVLLGGKQPPSTKGMP
ncbi:hypothetical protein CW368_09315 [Actinomycetales bacterium SN12]|nr:hypothetical protein CW368_09315 [Actinomycetales bacterium SN12]